jgi:hypothetical protein
MDLIEKLKAGKRNIKEIKFPGTDETIGIAVLTEAETQEALFATERLFKEKGIEVSATIVSAYNSEANTQTLFRALVNPAKKKEDGTFEQYFSSIDEFRSLIGREAKDILIEEYNSFEEEISPSPLKLSEKALERIFTEVKKNPMLGNALSLNTLRQLTMYLVNQVSILQKDNGSTSLA